MIFLSDKEKEILYEKLLQEIQRGEITVEEAEHQYQDIVNPQYPTREW